MTKYRISEFVNGNDDKVYRIEFRWMFYWFYMRNSFEDIIEYRNIDDAESEINQMIKDEIIAERNLVSYIYPPFEQE